MGAVGKIPVKATVRAGENRRMVAKVREHEIVMDLREERGGDNAGPSPPECLALSIGGCVVNIARIMADQKRIKLTNLTAEVSGAIDPSRAMGLDSPNRAGFLEMEIHVGFDSDLAAKDREAFHQELRQRCALCDTILNPTPLKIIC